MSDELTYEPPGLAKKPLDKEAGRIVPPTPEELARATLEPIYFEWFCERDRVVTAVAEAIRQDRARIRATVKRATYLIPALLRDLNWEVGKE